MKIISVVGARPNFMKIAPFIDAVKIYNDLKENSPIDHILVHTGQHYDSRMSDSFFSELGIPEPDINLEIGSGSHAEQLGKTMIAFEKVLLKQNPDWVVVVGDVNATLSCAIAAKRLGIKVCHIEAGLRSGDMKMPEEINRLVTDSISDLLLTPDIISSCNLQKEGIDEKKIVFAGNIMIDTLEKNHDRALAQSLKKIIEKNMLNGTCYNGGDLKDNEYSVVTLHRPSNVDYREIMEPIVSFLFNEVAVNNILVWPIHPRTRKQLQTFGILDKQLNSESIILLEPLGYLEMLRLNIGARLILTDSGGIQGECCVLGTPCLTLRLNTEWLITLRDHGGASVLVGNDIERIRNEYHRTLRMEKRAYRPDKWDGKTAERCLKAILDYNDQ